MFSRFSDLEKKVTNKHHLTPDKIYNAGEKNITVNPKGQSKILALEGCHPAGVLSSTQKGETVTGVMCFLASGAFVHPMLLLPRKRRQQAFQPDLPHGTWTDVYETFMFLVREIHRIVSSGGVTSASSAGWTQVPHQKLTAHE